MNEQNARQTHIPPCYMHRLDNGLRVAIVPALGNPFLTAHLLLPQGGLTDPPGLEGRAAFCAQLLRHGTHHRSELELSDQLDQVGARLGTSTYPDYIDIGGDVTTLEPNGVEVLLAALAEILQEPSFPVEEVEKVRSMRIGNLRRIIDHNEQVAARAFEQLLFEGHPAGRPVSGTVQSIRALQRADLTEFHRTHFTPQGSLLGLAGDVTEEDGLELARRHFGSWRGDEPRQLPCSPGPVRARPRVVLVDRQDPGLTQVHWRIGHPLSIPLDSPQLFPFRLAAQAFGGDFTARINQRLRVQEGLTYGARFAYRLTTALPGSASIVTYVEATKLRASLDMAFAEVDQLLANGLSDTELVDVKEKIVLGFPFRFETPPSTLEQHLWTIRERLPADFLARYQERIDQVSRTEVDQIIPTAMPDRTRALVVAVANRSAANTLDGLMPDVEPEIISLADLGI